MDIPGAHNTLYQKSNREIVKPRSTCFKERATSTI